jgi:hypothetical protein
LCPATSPSPSLSPHLYGERVDALAREVVDLLEARSPSRQFWDWPGDTEVVLAQKPG